VADRKTLASESAVLDAHQVSGIGAAGRNGRLDESAADPGDRRHRAAA
jgi:hypothetical protein